jgi:hypothetical protein
MGRQRPLKANSRGRTLNSLGSTLDDLFLHELRVLFPVDNKNKWE